MAREPEDEEPAGAAARARGHRGLPGQAGAGALRPSLWLFCLVACWLLGAVARADFSILDEAQVLASQMRRLAAEELGVVTMQVRGPHCAPKLARHSASPAQSPFPRAGPRDRAPTSPARTAPLPLPLSRDTSVLCTGSPTPICTPTLPCAQVLLPFSSAEAHCPLHGTHSPSQPARISAGILRSPRTAFPRVHDSPPQSCFYPRRPCKLPFPLCVPIPGQPAPPGSDDFPRPPAHPLTTSSCPPLPRALRGARGEGSSRGGTRSCSRATWAPAERGSERTRSSVPAGCTGGGAGVVDSWWIPDSSPVGETFVVIAVVRCVLSAVGFLFCFVPAFWGRGVGTQ